MARNLPFEEQVRVRAYEIFLARGGTGGSPEQDWIQAEQEVRRQQADGGDAAVPADALLDAETKPGPSAGAVRDSSRGGKAIRTTKAPATSRRSQ